MNENVKGTCPDCQVEHRTLEPSTYQEDTSIDLRHYVLVDLDSGTVLGDPRRVVLVHDENMPDGDPSDSEIIAAAEASGFRLDVDYFN